MPRCQILVVDNDDDHRQIMVQLLARFGYQAQAVESGEAAMERLEQEPVMLVIADLIMPGMGGVELCRQVKRYYPETVVLAFSGHIGLYPEDRLQRAGFDGLLDKPIAVEQLQRALDAAFARQPAGKARHAASRRTEDRP